VRATWITKGTRQQVMTPGTNRRRTIFGAVDLHTGRWFYQVARKAVSATFIAFLDQLAAGYPAAPTVAVVCDNVIIHHSKIVQRWLAAHPRVVVLHGARYSPHDNPVERIWGALKAWLATSPTLTIQGRLRQVHAFFRQRSPTQILATAAPSSSPWMPEGLHAELPGGRLAGGAHASMAERAFHAAAERLVAGQGRLSRNVRFCDRRQQHARASSRSTTLEAGTWRSTGAGGIRAGGLSRERVRRRRPGHAAYKEGSATAGMVAVAGSAALPRNGRPKADSMERSSE
jgi:transposase